MDFLDLAKLMYRWWFVTVPLVLLTFVLAFVVSSRIQPEYTAQGSMMLIAPSGPVEGAEDLQTVNPLLSANGALPTTAYVTALSATSPQVASLLASEGLSTSYDVAAQERLPIILLETRAESREVATDTALRLVELIDQDLQFRQDAAVVPQEERVTAEVISVAVVGGADYGGRARLQIAVVGLGLLTTVGVAFLLESLSRRRSTASGSTQDEADQTEAAPMRPSVRIGRRGSDRARSSRHPDSATRLDDDGTLDEASAATSSQRVSSRTD